MEKWKKMIKDTLKAGIAIDEAAFAVALVSDISFESAKLQIENILNAFSEPNLKAAEMIAKITGDSDEK